MTLQELRLKAAHLSGFTGGNVEPQFDAIIDWLINEALLRYSKLGRIPRANEVLSGVNTQQVALGRTPQTPDGVFTVFDITNKRRLVVSDLYNADNVWPDRDTASPGNPRMVVWDAINDATHLHIFPMPSPSVDLRVLYAYVPTRLERDADEPWDGQLEQYHELLAVSAALDYTRRRIGEDSAEKLSDQNPYGPLNPITTLSKHLQRLEAEFLAATATVTTRHPTADAYGGWHAPGWRWTDPALPVELG